MKCECMRVYRNGGKTLSQSISKIQKKKQRNHNNMEWRHDITKKKNKETVLLRYVLLFLFVHLLRTEKDIKDEKKKTGDSINNKKKGRAEALPFQCRFPSSPHTLCRFGEKDIERKEKTEHKTGKKNTKIGRNKNRNRERKTGPRCDENYKNF